MEQPSFVIDAVPSHAQLEEVDRYTCVVEGPDRWNQVLDNAHREPAARWESEGIGYRLATDYRKAQKRRRGTSGEATKSEGRVLHHLCWDDLYAMAGTMDHLTRILLNGLVCNGKRKASPSLQVHTQSTILEMLLRSPATMVDVGSGEWWRAWRLWARGWRGVVARRPACGTESPKPTPCGCGASWCW